MTMLGSILKQRNKNGQATLEFAFVAILFFGLLFVIIDIGALFFVNLTMQHAVREGTRRAVTGNTYSAIDRRTAVITQIREQSMGFYDKNTRTVKEPTIKVITPGNVTFANYTGGVTQTSNPGQAGDTIVVSLTYSWPLLTPILRPFFPGGEYTFTVRSTMRNEPFPTSGGSP